MTTHTGKRPSQHGPGLPGKHPTSSLRKKRALALTRDPRLGAGVGGERALGLLLDRMKRRSTALKHELICKTHANYHVRLARAWPATSSCLCRPRQP